MAKGKWGGKIVAKPVRFYDEEATSIEGIDFKTTELSLTRGETTFNRFNLEEDHAQFISTTRGGWIPRGTSSPSSGPFLTNPDSSEERRYYCRDVCIYIYKIQSKLSRRLARYLLLRLFNLLLNKCLEDVGLDLDFIQLGRGQATFFQDGS